MAASVSGVVTAAGAGAAVGAGLLWMVHRLQVYWWATSFCGSADVGEETYLLYPWVVWSVAGGVGLGAAAGRWTHLRLGGHGVVGAGIGIVAAAVTGTLAAVWPTLAALAGLAECISAADVHRYVPAAVVLGFLFALAALVQRGVSAGLVVGYAWACLLAASVGVTAAVENRPQHASLGEARVPDQPPSPTQDVPALVGIWALVVLAVALGGWLGHRHRDAVTGLSAAAAVVVPLFASLVIGNA